MPKLRIVADERERGSGVLEALASLGVLVEVERLEVGDYLLSPEVGVERKALRDLVVSIYDGRLFRQAGELAGQFAKPILVVEGNLAELPYLAENPKAVYGAIASLTLKTPLKLLYTQNPLETAQLLALLADHLHREARKGPLIYRPKRAIELREQQLAVVSSLPGVGGVLAQRLLAHFKTPRGVFRASVSELARVKGMGRARAERLCRILDSPYTPEEGGEGAQSRLSNL